MSDSDHNGEGRFTTSIEGWGSPRLRVRKRVEKVQPTDLPHQKVLPVKRPLLLKLEQIARSLARDGEEATAGVTLDKGSTFLAEGSYSSAPLHRPNHTSRVPHHTAS